MKNHDVLFTKDNKIFGFRSSGVLIQGGKILIQRGVNDTVYALPGGHVAFGETSAETIVREYKEETGADIIAKRLIWVDESLWTWGDKDAHTVCFYHLLEIENANTMPLDGEFKSLKTNDSELFLKWVALSDLKNIELLPDFIKVKAANIADGVEHFVYREGYNLMKNYEIVEITPNELPLCTSFWGDSNDRRLIERKTFVYKTNGEYVGGCALFERYEKCGHLSHLVVKSDLRGQGIGSRILEFAIEHLKEMGMEIMRLHVDKDNLKAIKLYEKYGFVHSEDATPEKMIMIKELRR